MGLAEAVLLLGAGAALHGMWRSWKNRTAPVEIAEEIEPEEIEPDEDNEEAPVAYEVRLLNEQGLTVLSETFDGDPDVDDSWVTGYQGEKELRIWTPDNMALVIRQLE